MSARKGGQMGVRLKTSVSLSVFERPQGMPALFSGGTEKNIKRIKELGYDGVDLFVIHLIRQLKKPCSCLGTTSLELGQLCLRRWQGKGYFWEI